MDMKIDILRKKRPYTKTLTEPVAIYLAGIITMEENFRIKSV